MTDNHARRVALLARPGIACDRLRDALDAAGAQCVLEADPAGLEPADLDAAGAQVVVVALDTVSEDALDRFEAVLGDPSIDVIFEEAELAATREGWDAARWQRHMVVKLRGNGSVLPPGPVSDDTPVAAAPLAAAATTPSRAGQLADPFDPVNAEFSADASPDDEFGLAAVESSSGASDTPASAGEFEAGIDPILAEAAAQPLAPVDADGAETDATGDATGFGELSLDDGDSAHGVVKSEEDAERFRHDLMDLEQRISGLELVDDTPRRGPESARGAVLVLAGLGGPDAVRQLLGALPTDFARPVMVQQRLDGGRYDKLVAQMQRATAAPVALAESGHPAQAGTVYILPDKMGLDSSDGLRFDEAGDDVLVALPAADSAVLLLSGSDPAIVDTIMNHNWSGALVAGQNADGCYDPAAANALAARGGETGKPAELALLLAERWPADKS